MTAPWKGYEGVYLINQSDLGAATHAQITASLAPPNASATPATASGTAPFPVAWTDQSTGYATDWTWDFRDGYFSFVQNASHVFTSAGTYAVRFTPLSPFGDSVFISNVSVSTPQSFVGFYTQRQVRIKAVDAYGAPIIGANVTASYINSSLPSTDISWLISAFGVSADVATEMTNSALAMTGWTGADGSVTFVMFPSLTYGITLTNTSVGLSHYTTISPTDSDYVVYAALSQSESAKFNVTQQQISNATLYITEPNNSYVTFNLIYYDGSALTTNLLFNVTCWDNMTPMYYIDFGNPGKNVITDSNYTVPNVRGQEWKFWWNATRSAPY